MHTGYFSELLWSSWRDAFRSSECVAWYLSVALFPCNGCLYMAWLDPENGSMVLRIESDRVDDLQLQGLCFGP